MQWIILKNFFFINKPIEEPRVKHLKNIDRLKQIKHLEDMQCHTKLK